MIEEEQIMVMLDMLLSSSEPGADLHHLIVLTAPGAGLGPLGLPDPATVHSTVYAIAPTGEVDVEAFIATTIAAAGAEAAKHQQVVLFAGLSSECWSVTGTTGLDPLAVRLHAQDRLSEHPDAVETTLVYAACRDGRRWRGRRHLTGPHAGTTEHVDLLVGQPARGEGGRGVPDRLLRLLVGIGRGA